MPLSRLTIQNFQSHSNTELVLGRFTVIVGHSSSGKSAIIRALRLLVSNARGTTYVRHGATKTRVSAAFTSFEGDPADAAIQVSVERGVGTSRYELTLPGQDVIEFTKCGISVPDMVLESHDLGTDELWVAGQFDRPFLLDDTGSAVARRLGDLTNVSLIFAASGECNTRATRAKSKYADRVAQRDLVRAELQTYSDLPTKLAACVRAEEAFESARGMESRRDRLSALCEEVQSSFSRVINARAQLCVVPHVGDLVTAESRRSRLGELLRNVEDAEARRASVRQVICPDVGSLLAMYERRTRLCTIITEVVQSELTRRQAAERVAAVKTAVRESSQQLQAALEEAGACPVCGASPEHAQLDLVAGVSH